MRTLKVKYSSLFDGLESKPDSYKVLADEYEWPKRDVEKHVEGLRFDEFQRFLDHHLGSERGKIVVECGCGLGGNLLRFSSDNLCVGIDFSLTALRKIKAYGSALRPTGADIRNLPLRDECADYVVFSRVLFIYEDLRQIKTMLLEARRVLKSDGGVIVVNDYCNAGVWLATSIRDLLGWVSGFLPRKNSDDREFMLYYFSRRDMVTLFAEADLELQETHLCNVHMGLFHLTYHNPLLGIMLRSLRRYYRTRRMDHWERSRQARKINDAYPLNWIGQFIVWLVDGRFSGLGALSVCNLAVKR